MFGTFAWKMAETSNWLSKQLQINFLSIDKAFNQLFFVAAAAAALFQIVDLFYLALLLCKWIWVCIVWSILLYWFVFYFFRVKIILKWKVCIQSDLFKDTVYCYLINSEYWHYYSVEHALDFSDPVMPHLSTSYFECFPASISWSATVCTPIFHSSLTSIVYIQYSQSFHCLVV